MKTNIALLLLSIAFSSQGIILGTQAPTMINQVPSNMSPVFLKQTPTMTPGFIKQNPINGFIKQSPTVIPTVPIGIKAEPMLINHQYPQTILPLPSQPIYTQPIYTQPIYSQPIYTQPILTAVNPTISTGVMTATTSMLLPINATTSRIVYPYNYVEQCKVSGLYRHLCLRQYDTTNYIDTVFHRRYDCLKDAVCSFRAGKCQWLQTRRFKKCLVNYQKLGFLTYKNPVSNFPVTFLGEHY